MGFDALVAKENLALVRRVEARDAIEKRRFSCAVGTDDAQDLSFLHGEIHSRNGSESAESLRDAPALQKCFAHTLNLCMLLLRIMPNDPQPRLFTSCETAIRPRGMNKTTSTMIIPKNALWNSVNAPHR